MTYDTLKLDKGLYTSAKGFTNALEEIDPSENYKGTELEGLDAYQRQLKRFDIKVSGKNCDSISKFFQTSDSAALFPEYVSRAVKCGIECNNVVDDIVATTTYVEGLDYRSIESLNTNPVKTGEIDYINEGAYIPETVIKTRDELTKLRKCGRSLVASYESIKYQKLDLFTVALKQIGNYIANCQMTQLLDMVSDYNINDSIEVDADLTYSDLINMWGALGNYRMNVLIAEPEDFYSILNMKEFRDAAAGLNFHATGEMITPFGAKLIKAPVSTLYGTMVGLDKDYAIEKVQFGDIVTDFDRLIDRQLERTTITSTFGFARIIPDSMIVATKSM